MHFGLIANLQRPGAKEAIQKMVDWSHARKQELILCDELREAIPGFPRYEKRTEIGKHVDVVVSMGGDGTLLATARALGRAGVPILGVNIGSLGFLTQRRPDEMPSALDAVVAGNYRIEERMLLKAEVTGRASMENTYALNDVVIDNGPISRLIDINLRVNGEDVVTYRADGLVLATPTGSTAYSLAVGGPIVNPRMEAIIVSAISSFSLTSRPIVFSGSDVLTLSIKGENRVAGLTIDGQIMKPLGESESVRVSAADFKAKLIALEHDSFYKLVREKLHWGVTPSLKER
ncbi:MAG: NAD(+)/NADH kinase [Candidatus Zixiibacteriota bacterium]